MQRSIETSRLILRGLAIQDVDLLVELDSDPEVMRYLTNGKPTSHEAMTAIVQKTLGHRWLSFEKATGEFIGWFGLPRTADDEYEIGYRRRRTTWGKGFASEGVCALLAVAFSERGARRIWAQTMAVNIRSRRVMERCGLRYVRTFHGQFDDPIPGTEHGEVEYEICKDDWLPWANDAHRDPTRS